MRFPRVCASERVSVNVERKALLSRCDIGLPTIIEEIDVDLLENIVGFTDDTVSTVRYYTYLKRIWCTFSASYEKYLYLLVFF